MENVLIQINWPYFLGILGGLVLVAYYANGRFTKIETDMDWVKDTLKEIKNDSDGKRIQAFGTQSPITLLDKGKTILLDSGLKAYIDRNQDELIRQSCKGNKFDNPYDIQERAFDFFDSYNFGAFEKNLKETAFNNGVSIELVRRVGGIYFRDILLAEFNFKPADLDEADK